MTPNGVEPDPGQLRAFTGQVHQQLQSWRLLIATTHRPYANLLTIRLSELDPQPPHLPQRLLAVCDSAAAVREQLPAEADDVLLFIEESLSDGSVLPLVEALQRSVNPPTILMAMAGPLQPALVQAAWRAGVHALVCSDDFGSGELARALAAINQGVRYCGPACEPLLSSQGPATDALSRRELEVLPLLAEGLTNRQIAARLQIAEVTARDHVQKILHKLQVSDRAAAAALAVRLGLAR
jgi:DNA-binding NarL/FixJ family response regulator